MSDASVGLFVMHNFVVVRGVEVGYTGGEEGVLWVSILIRLILSSRDGKGAWRGGLSQVPRNELHGVVRMSSRLTPEVHVEDARATSHPRWFYTNTTTTTFQFYLFFTIDDFAFAISAFVVFA